MKKTLLQEYIKSLFIKPLVLITLTTTDNPIMVTQNPVFRERFEQYPVNKRLAHIMNKDKKIY